MALYFRLPFPNPEKARTLGLSDTIQSDAYGYTALYTVTGAETLQIIDGIFHVDGSNTSGALNEVKMILDISGKETVLHCDNNIGVSALINTTVTFADLSLGPITLATGDTITLKCIYPVAAGAYTANFKGTLFLADFTA